MPLGSVLNGRYVVAREIGRGGMGVVFEAHDSNLERAVAVKFLSAEFSDNREAVQRFQQEALAASRLGHPNICNVHDRGTSDEGIPYIVMELLEGESLADRMERDGQLPACDAILIMVQVLSALASVHRKGIVHRDLKPENIFIARDDGDDETVKLVDFGISKNMGELIVNKLTRGGTVMGTPYYMSPEQSRGKSDLVDHRSDIWAVGVITYEAITGEPPFFGSNNLEVLANIQRLDPIDPHKYVPELPHGLVVATLRALQKDPEERYVDAAEFAAVLRNCIDEESESSYQLKAKGLDRIRSQPVSPSQPPIEVPGRPSPTAPPPPESKDSVAETPSPVPPRRPSDPDRRAPGKASTPLPSAGPGGLSWKIWAAVGAGVIILGCVTGVVAGSLANTDDGDDEETVVPVTSTDGELPAPEPDPVPAPEPEPEPAPDPEPEPEIPAPPSVEVRLIGVPSDASVSFDGEPVEGNVIRGPMDTAGALVVTRPGQPALRLALTLTVGMSEINIGERLGLSPPPLPVDSPSQDASTSGDSGSDSE